MLIACACAYVALFLFMVFFRDHAFKYIHSEDPERPPAVLPLRPPRSKDVLHRIEELARMPSQKVFGSTAWRVRAPRKPNETGVHSTSFSRFVTSLLSLDGIYHAYYHALLDLPKLAFQTVALSQYLTEGFPLPLICFYSTLLLINWLVSFYRFQRQAEDRDLIVTRLFYPFDLFFAVFAPVIVLAYAYNQFDMNRKVFAIREKTLSPGSYDLTARLFADPVQKDVFRYEFEHLQLRTVGYLIAKTSLNALVVYKWKKIIIFLVIQRPVQNRRAKVQANEKLPQKHTDEKPKKRSRESILKRLVRVHGKRRHLLFGIVAFLVSIGMILAYVIVSVRNSIDNCASIPERRVISYRWSSGPSECPCIVFINRNQAPKTFSEWVNATDTTEALAAAAKSGHLKTVQIINRAIVELPEELRRCEEMEQLILIYTKTQPLPGWVGEFHKLNYMPPFAHDARALDPARSHSTAAIGRSGKSRHAFLGAAHLKRPPSLQPLKHLQSFSLFRRNAMCCNGFLSDTCDLANEQCRPRVGEDPVTCETSRLPKEDRDLLPRIDALVCSKNLTGDVVDSEPTEVSTDGVCQGVLYKQCQWNNHTGICYNGRMQVVHCDVFGEYEAMRCFETAQGVGTGCDPAVEGAPTYKTCDV